jgi:2-polyprenyl-6-methoxyphenol hydroxylase-like FAD-dependent oxidoreductase
MLEWLILGGGVHGTHLSLALRARGVPEHHLRVLDPHPRPLAAWDRRARSIGMPFLRSPDMHHIDLSAPSLHLFAHRHAGHRDLIRRYHRPSLALFSEHVEHVVTSNRLDQLRLRGQATRIDPKGDTFRVDSDQGQLHARRLVIAVGAASNKSGGAPWLTPELAWAPRIYVSGALAELQLGPAAGNIIGARLAARRIASSS